VPAVLVAESFLAGAVLGALVDLATGRIVRPVADRAVLVAPGATGLAPAEGAMPRIPPPAELAVSALLTSVWLGLAALRLGATPVLGAYDALGVGLVAAAVVDARAGIVPRVIVWPTLGVVAAGLLAASGATGRFRPLLDAAIGGAAAFASFFALWWGFPRGLGYGDVRLAGLIGTALGWLGFGELYIGFLAAFVAGTALGVVLMARRGTGRKTVLPFGPPLALGAAIGILWGPWAVHLWLAHR